MPDARRKAADAIIAALIDGQTLLQIVELAMDDVTTPDNVVTELSEEYDRLTAF